MTDRLTPQQRLQAQYTQRYYWLEGPGGKPDRKHEVMGIIHKLAEKMPLEQVERILNDYNDLQLPARAESLAGGQ